MEQFQPNANNILDVLYNKKPKYLLYMNITSILNL